MDELNRNKTEATSQIYIKEYFKDIEKDEVLTPKLIKLVTDGKIKVVQVTEVEPPTWWDTRSEKGIYINIKLRIKGKYFWSQDLVELRYITHSSENTFTEWIAIKLDGKLYENGIGNDRHQYYTDCGCVFSRCLRNCHAEEIYVLRKLHTIFNIDYDQTAAMIHLLFGCWSKYNSKRGHPYIKDSIQSLEELIKMWE